MRGGLPACKSQVGVLMPRPVVMLLSTGRCSRPPKIDNEVDAFAMMTAVSLSSTPLLICKP